MKIKTMVVLWLVILLSGCQIEPQMSELFLQDVADVQSRWVPEKRIKVFEFDYQYNGDQKKWVIYSETTEPDAQKELAGLINRYFDEDEVEFNYKILPDKELGDSTYALVRISVANLRKVRGSRSELIDQLLMGTELKILKRKGYWYYVQTSYGYLGWTGAGSIERIGSGALAEWQNAEKVMVKRNYARVFSNPDESSIQVTDAVLGVIFKKIGTSGSWVHVELPDKRTGFISGSALGDFFTPDTQLVPDRDRIVAAAKNFMGIPYLWGGNSTKAFDCSGFTQTVFESEGYQLPRDADLQVLEGEEIVPQKDYKNVKAGDLIFFGGGERITHVGICLGGHYFIHCASDVHINSLDENDPLFNEYRKKTLRHIKRVIKD